MKVIDVVNPKAPRKTKLDHINLKVRDFEETVKFFENVFLAAGFAQLGEYDIYEDEVGFVSASADVAFTFSRIEDLDDSDAKLPDGYARLVLRIASSELINDIYEKAIKQGAKSLQPPERNTKNLSDGTELSSEILQGLPFEAEFCAPCGINVYLFCYDGLE